MVERVTVVYIINSLSVGGAEMGMCRLIDGLDPEKYSVTVVVLDGQSMDLEEKIPSWVEIIRPRSTLIRDSQALLRLIHSIRGANVIVGSLYHSAIVAKLAGTIKRDATVATWRHNTQFKTRKRETVFKWTTAMNDVILADSEPVLETLIDEKHIDESLVYKVPIAGINLDNYTPVLHQETNTPVVGTVGRLTRQKNHSVILSVAEQLRESEIAFKIAGEGELYEELKEEIRERGLTNVTLNGFVKDVPQFLSSLDIYFQPSLYEGLCITVLEAMATGLPVVGSDVGGIGQSIDHNTSGYLYEPGDINMFASAIMELADNPELRSRFGEQGQNTVARNFTQENLVSRFEKAIRER